MKMLSSANQVARQIARFMPVPTDWNFRRPKDHLPGGVKYGSFEAAKNYLATLAFPIYRPQFFMWAETAERTAQCVVCGRPIVPGDVRVVTHSYSNHSSEIRQANGRSFHLRHRRESMHHSCLWDALQTGQKPRDRLECFDCGAPPPASVHTDRVSLNGQLHTAFLCLECRDKKWWFVCVGCGVYHRRGKLVEVLPSRGATAANAKSKDGRLYACRSCQRTNRFETPDDAAIAAEAARAEERKFREYRDAVARGEKPEIPWTPDELERLYEDADTLRGF